MTTGAAVSVDPVTATLPVAPGSVHSGVPPFCRRAVGHGAGAAGWFGSATGNGYGLGSAILELAEAAGDESGVASASEPHPASNMTSVVAQTADATEPKAREEFTAATLPPPETGSTPQCGLRNISET